jgi:hypothetical protein
MKGVCKKPEIVKQKISNIGTLVIMEEYEPIFFSLQINN